MQTTFDNYAKRYFAVNRCYHYVCYYFANNYRFTLKSHAELLPVMPFLWYRTPPNTVYYAPFGIRLQITLALIFYNFYYAK